MLEFLSSTGIVLTVIFILFAVIYFLILFILLFRILENIRIEQKKNFIERHENHIFRYIVEDIPPKEIIKLIPKSSYQSLLEHLRPLYLNLKGEDKKKLNALVNETPLFDYLMEELNSSNKKKTRFGAYYLGLSESHTAKFPLLKRMKMGDEFVFITAALSLARLNAIDALDDILSEAKRYKDISQDTILNILYEFDEAVCEKLLLHLNHDASSKVKSLIITTLRHFKYVPAAPVVLNILIDEQDTGVIVNALLYFGDIEYIDAANTVRFYLINARPEIKIAAIKAAEKVGASNLQNRIWDLLYDKNRFVKVTAANALFDYSENSRKDLEQLAYRLPGTMESSIARMLISQKTIHLN